MELCSQVETGIANVAIMGRVNAPFLCVGPSSATIMFDFIVPHSYFGVWMLLLLELRMFTYFPCLTRYTYWNAVVVVGGGVLIQFSQLISTKI